jgi:alpha-beta hydrolase superfamily lysophospholipase
MLPSKKSSIMLKSVLAVVAIALAGGLYFIYSVVPEKVARTIMSKAPFHKPLTLTPKQYGLRYEDVSTSGNGVTLSGWWLLTPKKPLGTVLLTHGVFKNREQVLTRAEFLVKSGYRVLLFDQRGCGLSSDSAVSGGVLESEDYLLWTGYLKAHHRLQKPLVFFGFSMGSMSALRAVIKEPEADAVIADSPLVNLNSYVSRRTMGGRFSSLPGFLNRCLQAYDRLSGLSLTPGDLDMIPVVQQLHELPVLYITGEGDDLAKSEEVRILFEKSASHRRRLVYIPDAGHEETFVKFPIIYKKAVMEFLTDLTAKPKKEESE